MVPLQGQNKDRIRLNHLTIWEAGIMAMSEGLCPQEAHSLVQNWGTDSLAIISNPLIL